MANKMAIGAVVAGAIILGGLIGASASIKKIEPGFAGVVYNTSGGIEDQTLGQGWHLVAPLKKVTEYPTSTETVQLLKSGKSDESFTVSTREGKQVNLDTRYSYHMETEKLPAIFTKFRGADASSIEAGYLKTNLQAVVQDVTSSYGVLDLYGGKRDEITQKVFKEFTDRMAVQGIIIEQFTFGEIRPDEATLKAIQENVNAQQALATLEVQKQQATAEAERKRIEAQGNADKALIEATGQAKANEVLKQSLTPELVQMEIAKKWNGVLPTVSGGATPMIQLPQATPSK